MAVSGLMQHFRAVLAVAIALLWGGEAWAAGCGEFYRVKRGDTLRSITVDVLGHDRYDVIFAANRDVIKNPSRIEIGQLLFVPCADSGPRTRVSALNASGRRTTARDDLGDRLARNAPPRTTTPEVTRPVQQPVLQAPAGPRIVRPAQIRVLTHSGLPPLADEGLPGGGLMARLIAEALGAAGVATAPEIAFVNDRWAHVDVLMTLGVFDFGAPWPAPDCRAPRGSTSRWMCRTFLFSRPIFQMSVATWVRADDASVRNAGPDWFRGRRICRPAGYPAVDLEAMDALPVIISARTAGACFDLLRAGQADAVSLPGALDVQPGGAVRASRLDREIPIHALAWREDPQAVNRIALLDQGLEKLQASGRWFEIVSTYLSTYNARVGAAPAN